MIQLTTVFIEVRIVFGTFQYTQVKNKAEENEKQTTSCECHTDQLRTGKTKLFLSHFLRFVTF